MLSQNVPFAPIYHSWKAGENILLKFTSDEGKDQIQNIAAKVLSNQRCRIIYAFLAYQAGYYPVTKNYKIKKPAKVSLCNKKQDILQ
ncbi:hypothetical protein ccbrp13_32610 [Ktedonobacteria bacterium brp13]|nr:hypothetical protein ccbrp13_32610 [Ktedonobacteria bacterium brp13]